MEDLKMSLNVEESYNRFVEKHGFTFEDVLRYLGKTIDEVDSVILLLYVEGLVDCCNQFKSEWNIENYIKGYVLVGSSSFKCLICCCMAY